MSEATIDRGATGIGHLVHYLAPAGRVLFSLIFVVSGVGHFAPATIQFAASQGVPFATFLVPVSGVMAVAGGFSVMFGYRAKWGAALLVAFLLPVTFAMHRFWAVSDPMVKQMQLASFLKNLALVGGALFIGYFGAGPGSVDERRHAA